MIVRGAGASHRMIPEPLGRTAHLLGSPQPPAPNESRRVESPHHAASRMHAQYCTALDWYPICMTSVMPSVAPTPSRSQPPIRTDEYSVGIPLGDGSRTRWGWAQGDEPPFDQQGGNDRAGTLHIPLQLSFAQPCEAEGMCSASHNPARSPLSQCGPNAVPLGVGPSPLSFHRLRGADPLLGALHPISQWCTPHLHFHMLTRRSRAASRPGRAPSSARRAGAPHSPA